MNVPAEVLNIYKKKLLSSKEATLKVIENHSEHSLENLQMLTHQLAGLAGYFGDEEIGEISGDIDQSIRSKTIGVKESFNDNFMSTLNHFLEICEKSEHYQV